MIAPSGFDRTTWDPSHDNFLPQRYSADDMKGKTVCKFALQRHLGLEEGASKILVSFSPVNIFVQPEWNRSASGTSRTSPRCDSSIFYGTFMAINVA